jgi:hypothetical protein
MIRPSASNETIVDGAICTVSVTVLPDCVRV